LQKVFEAALGRVIPAEGVGALKGHTFREWEDQADAFDRTVTAALLEERAALEENARVAEGGRCPFCSSRNVYMRKEQGKVEVRTTHGVAVVERQKARCRGCGRTFSPSGPGLGTAGGSRGALAQGGRAGGAGGGDPAL
jgi:DNA-directed RNA polymerase subunit RPC12/RpoP